MNLDGFGFKALTVRANELGIEFPNIPQENLFDLASYVAYLSEKRLSIKQILWFNSLLDREFLDGKTEAEYFKLRKFKEIAESVSSKAVGLACVAEEIQAGTVKTEKPFAEPNYRLTKEERSARALKIEAAREQMLKDPIEHNRRIQRKREEAIEQYAVEEEVDGGLFFFDSAHPFISLFASWFTNRK